MFEIVCGRRRERKEAVRREEGETRKDGTKRARRDEEGQGGRKEEANSNHTLQKRKTQAPIISCGRKRWGYHPSNLRQVKNFAPSSLLLPPSSLLPPPKSFGFSALSASSRLPSLLPPPPPPSPSSLPP
jgi:hypothetical protein